MEVLSLRRSGQEMADADQVTLLKRDVASWNAWRAKNIDVRPDLSGAELRVARLCGADLRGADLHEANLCGADLRMANLRGADLHEAQLRGANFEGTRLRDADLR